MNVDEGLAVDLERFVRDNPDLERLEAILDDFNPFTALRWTRQELRHSAFLRWLMDPRESHRLGPYFLKAVLKLIADRSDSGPTVPSIVEVDSWAHDSTLVETEWRKIDILVRDDRQKFVAVIENKVDSSEGPEQLKRYRELVAKTFPGYHTLFGYLTVNGDDPSDGAYGAISYQEIATLIDVAVERRGDQISPAVADFLGHYVTMLRRHILEDSEIQELCRKIYSTHRRALDVVFENRPDRAAEVHDILVDLVKNQDGISIAPSSKNYVRFLPDDLSFLPKVGTGWGDGNLILFELLQTQGDVRLKITLGPGDAGVREHIAEHISGQSAVFSRADKKISSTWWGFHTTAGWIPKLTYQEADEDELRERLGAKLAEFVRDDLPAMVDALQPLSATDWDALSSSPSTES